MYRCYTACITRIMNNALTNKCLLWNLSWLIKAALEPWRPFLTKCHVELCEFTAGSSHCVWGPHHVVLSTACLCSVFLADRLWILVFLWLKIYVCHVHRFLPVSWKPIRMWHRWAWLRPRCASYRHGSPCQSLESPIFLPSECCLT